MSDIDDTFNQARCINVTYTSPDRGATVELYTANLTDLAGLGSELAVTIERGTGAAGGASGDCTGFVAGSTIYTGTFANLASHSTFATGLGGWVATTGGDTASYRITIDGSAITVSSATVTTDFIWESQS